VAYVHRAPVTTSAARTGRKHPSASSNQGTASGCVGRGGSVARRRVAPLDESTAHIRVFVSDGTIVTLNSRIAFLRIALGGDFPRQRCVHDASFRCLLGTLFHHACLPTSPVRAVPIAMIEPPFRRSLMPPPALAQRPVTSRRAASLRAVTVTVIASRAQEENLPTLDDSTHHEAK
jgi:hypothetical protein